MQNFQGKSALDAEIGRGASPSRRKVLRLLGKLSLLQNQLHSPPFGGPGKALTCICEGDEVTSAVFNYTTGPEHAD